MKSSDQGMSRLGAQKWRSSVEAWEWPVWPVAHHQVGGLYRKARGSPTLMKFPRRGSRVLFVSCQGFNLQEDGLQYQVQSRLAMNLKDSLEAIAIRLEAIASRLEAIAAEPSHHDNWGNY